MRLRDHPIVEVSRRLPCTPERAWEAVTDITLPARGAGELQSAEWLDGSDRVAVGATFRGNNSNEMLGEWSTVCTVVEVDDGRRWVWSVGPSIDDPWAVWGFEVDPSREGATVRQWARIGTGDSPFRGMVEAAPEKEGAIIAARLRSWQQALDANLSTIEAELD